MIGLIGMLDNKILIDLYVLTLDKNFEFYIPIDEKVGNVVKLVNLYLLGNASNNKNYSLLNLYSGNVYKNNDLIRNTDIMNGTKLMLL